MNKDPMIFTSPMLPHPESGYAKAMALGVLLGCLAMYLGTELARNSMRDVRDTRPVSVRPVQLPAITLNQPVRETVRTVVPEIVRVTVPVQKSLPAIKIDWTEFAEAFGKIKSTPSSLPSSMGHVAVRGRAATSPAPGGEDEKEVIEGDRYATDPLHGELLPGPLE